MHARPPSRRMRWPWVGAGLAVVLLAWLAPNPLPWRSPLQSRPAEPTGVAALNLAVGAELAAHTGRAGTAPPPPGTPAPKQPAPGVPAGFHGTWRGTGANLLDGVNFSVVVTFPTKPAGAVVATADFPSYGCREVWQLEQSTPTVLTLRATLAAGLCIVRPLRVQARLVDRNHLAVQWQLLSTVVESEAQLARAG